MATRTRKAPAAKKAAAKRSAGRPRPQSTIDRDAQVLKILTKEGLTTADIAAKLSIKPSEAYLSIHRLGRANKVKSISDGGRRNTRYCPS